MAYDSLFLIYVLYDEFYSHFMLNIKCIQIDKYIFLYTNLSVLVGIIHSAYCLFLGYI